MIEGPDQEAREQAFEEILKSVDAGKKQDPTPEAVIAKPAGGFRLETPVKVAKESEGMTVSQLAGLFEHLSQERGSSVHVCVDGHAIREVEVTLRYRGDSSGPAEMAVELVV